MREVDVLVAGGGPAGLCAGIALAGHGLRTLVCERRQFPVDKACGEGIMPTGAADLQTLGAAAYLDGAIFPLAGIRYYSRRGHVATASFAEGPGWAVRRTELSTALAARARAMDCLDLRAGTRLQPLGRHDGRILANVGGEEVAARLLVGADGLASGVRRWAGLDGPPAGLRRWGARQHYQVAPWTDYVEVHWAPGVEAYVTPCGRDQVGLAFLWEPARYAGAAGGADLMPSMLRAFPALWERFEGARPLSAARAVGPMRRSSRSPVADGVALIGDAAGYLDAITGEGISLAARQALALAGAAVPLMHASGKALSARDLRPYAMAHRAIVWSYYRMTNLVLFLSRHPALAERAIRALAARPDVFQHLLSANMGLVSPWRVAPGQVAGLLRAIF